MNFVSELTYPNENFKNNDSNTITIVVTDVDKQIFWSSLYGYYYTQFHSKHTCYMVPNFKNMVKVGYMYRANLLRCNSEMHISGIYCLSTGKELFNFESKRAIQNVIAQEIKEDKIKLIDKLDERFKNLNPFSKACIESYRDYYYSREYNDIFDYIFYNRYIKIFTATENHIFGKRETIKADLDFLEYNAIDIYIKYFNKLNRYDVFATMIYEEDEKIKFKSEIFDKYDIDLNLKNKKTNLC